MLKAKEYTNIMLVKLLVITSLSNLFNSRVHQMDLEEIPTFFTRRPSFQETKMRKRLAAPHLRS